MPEEARESRPRVTPQPIEDELRRSYIDYAMSVIVGRALPDVRDGLKPVQRRILHAMNELGMSSGSAHKKAARVVGECLAKGTLVSTERGLVPIEDVHRGDRVFTEGGVSSVKELYEMPARPLVRINLDNGLSIVSTRSQKVRVVTPDLSFAWKDASAIEAKEWVVLRSVFAPFHTALPQLPPFAGREMRLDRNLAYLLGQFVSDGWVSREGGRIRLGFCSSDRQVMVRIQQIIRNQFAYQPSIERKVSTVSKSRILFVVRISRDAINQYLVQTFDLGAAYASTKSIPDQILRAPRPVAIAFLSGLVDGDGSIATARRTVHYGSVSEILIDRLQVLLHHLGYHAHRYTTRPTSRRARLNGRRVVGRYPFSSLEIRGDEALRLSGELDLAVRQKSRRAAAMRETARPMQLRSDLVPFGAQVVFPALTRAHLGSGWFADTEGRKFRAGIQHLSGRKIRYSADLMIRPLHLNQIVGWGILEKLRRIGSPLAQQFDLIEAADLTFVQVRSVEAAPQDVSYDIGLDKGHNFTANGIVVHNCLGKWHPHGDLAVYDALARMVQSFSLRYPLLDGQGNWGSTEDEPAAMRYTECRLAKTAEAMLEDLEKETVDWMDNFDGTLKEPTVLPSKFPNLLVNGSSGIAVGMATNIPPHNLGEIVDALIVLIDNPNAGLIDLYNPETGPIRGPDFPTGGILYGADGVADAYRNGRGLIRIRARANYEEAGHDRARIVITEIPYMVSKAALVESIALLVKSKRIEGVTDLRDESDREGMRIVLELKRDAVEDVVLNQLYHHTQMETTFGVINLALLDGQPKVLPLKESMQAFIDHRVVIVRRRTEFDLKKARERLHIVEGLITAVDHLDEVIRLIRRARDADEAQAGLINRYLLSENQAKAILSMTLRQLTGLEIEKLRTEKTDLNHKIESLESILASREKVFGILKTEFLEVKEKFGDDRRTTVELQAYDMEVEDLIPEEDVVVTITNTGYIKRVPATVYRTQKRGGKGVTGMETKEEDFVVDLFTASSHDYILFFSSKGQCYWLKTYRIPVGSRYAKGKPIVNLLPRLEPGERILDMIAVREFDPQRTIVFATKLGKIKQTRLDAFKRPNVRGIRAIALNEGDELVEARIADGDAEVILASAGGSANRFSLREVRAMGRTAAGVRGMRLRKDDRVVSMALVKSEETELLTVLESGFGKRTKVGEYRKTRRGSQGVKTTNMKTAQSSVVAVLEVEPIDELLVTTVGGIVIRCPIEGIRETGRAARGVRIQRLSEGDKVTAVVRLVRPTEEETAVGDSATPA
jgi:DNA gyrase subunit A